VEPARWCGGANLDCGLVRSDNGRSGNRFWLSLAQLADTGNPLIGEKTLQSYSSEARGLFCAPSKRYCPVPQTFCATKPNDGGFIEEKMRPGASNWPIYRTALKYDRSNVTPRLRDGRQTTLFARTTL
jgi:hypothetical protein